MDFRVHVPGMAYRGSDKRKLEKQRRDHRLCGLIQTELQQRYDEMKPGEWRSILAHQVARAIGEDSEEVRRIMCRIQGGSNGVTFYKPEDPNTPRESETAPQASTQERSAEGLLLGQRVKHDKLGAGSIAHIDGKKIEVEFDAAGRKRILESFIRPDHG
jgi:hypothetical protein